MFYSLKINSIWNVFDFVVYFPADDFARSVVCVCVCVYVCVCVCVCMRVCVHYSAENKYLYNMVSHAKHRGSWIEGAGVEFPIIQKYKTHYRAISGSPSRRRSAWLIHTLACHVQASIIQLSHRYNHPSPHPSRIKIMIFCSNRVPYSCELCFPPETPRRWLI